MKKLFLILLTVLFYFSPPIRYSQNLICEKTSYGCPEVNYKEIINKDGVYYKKFTSVPFTGKIIGKEIGLIEKGKKEGSWVGYYDNGKLRYTVNFNNGEREVGSYNGQGTFTYLNGDQYVGELKDGKKHGQGNYFLPMGINTLVNIKKIISMGKEPLLIQMEINT